MSDAAPKRTMAPIGPDTVIAGRWRIDRELSSTRHLTVWRAFDQRLEREVAIRAVRPSHHADADVQSDFRRHLELVGQVQSPNVMRVFDSVNHEGELLIISELVEGTPLDLVFAQRRRLNDQQVVALGLQLAHALCGLHQQAIVHRDIRPEHVVVTRDGTVKLVGLATVKWLRSDSTLTDQAALLSRISYLAPEQLTGHAIDTRIDVYAVALILWEALAARHPLDGNPPVVDGNPMPVPRISTAVAEVTEQLDDVLYQASRSDPGERLLDGCRLEEALRPLVNGRPEKTVQALVDPQLLTVRP